MMSGDGTEDRVREYLRALAGDVRPSPGYMERLRSGFRVARRRQAGAAAGGVLVCVLLVAGAIAVRPVTPAGGDRARSTAGTPSPDFIAEVVESPPDDWPPDPLRPRLLVRMDGTSRRPEAVVDGWRVAGPFQLLDDGSVVVMTGPRKPEGSGARGNCVSGTSRFERIAPTGERTGMGTVTGIISSVSLPFGLSPDGSLLAVAGRECRDRQGDGDWRLRVYRVNGTIAARPLVDRTIPGKYEDTWARPEFSGDGRLVAFSRSGATGPIVDNALPTAVTVFLLDLAGQRPSWTDRRALPSAAGCTTSLPGVLGRDPRTLVTSELCGPPVRRANSPTLHHLVEVDLRTGRARRLLSLPTPFLAGLDYDAGRSHLFIATSSRDGSADRSGTPSRPAYVLSSEVYVWDGERLRSLGRLPPLEAGIPPPPPTEHGTGRFLVHDAQW